MSQLTRLFQIGNFQKDMVSPWRCLKLIPFKLQQWILIKLTVVLMLRGKYTVKLALS